MYQFNQGFETSLFFYVIFYVRVPETKKLCCLKTKSLPWQSRNHGGRWFVLAPPWSDRRVACVNLFLTLCTIGWAHFFQKNNSQQFRNCSFVWCTRVSLFSTLLIMIKNQYYDNNLRLITIIIRGPPYHPPMGPLPGPGLSRVALSLHS